MDNVTMRRNSNTVDSFICKICKEEFMGKFSLAKTNCFSCRAEKKRLVSRESYRQKHSK